MLYSDDVLFIHVPKTGGMSITTYLLNNLKGPLTLSKPAVNVQTVRPDLHFDDIEPRLEIVKGKRHENLAQTADLLRRRGRALDEFAVVLVAMRNPYDLEVSYFEHMRKPDVIRRRGPDSAAVAAARTGDFEHFVKTAPFFWNSQLPIASFFTVDGNAPPNLRIVRFEAMSETLPQLVAPFSFERFFLPHENRTEGRRTYHDYLTPAAEAAIRDKYAFLFDYYPAESGIGAGKAEQDRS